jgi:hypothetical protein
LRSTQINRRGGICGRGGIRGGMGGYEGGRGGCFRRYYSIFPKEGHLSPNKPLKERIYLNFSNHYRVEDHCMEDFPTMLEKKKSVDILQAIPKHEFLNYNNLNVVTRLGAKIGEILFCKEQHKSHQSRTKNLAIPIHKHQRNT